MNTNEFLKGLEQAAHIIMVYCLCYFFWLNFHKNI
jgi:hypothetical protein